MPRASQAGIGWDLPFRSSGSRSRYSIAAAVSRRVAAPTVTAPIPLAACSRAATLTVSPITVYWSPIRPASTSPELMPTRSASSTPLVAARPPISVLISLIAACIARPALTARSGSSSCATGAPKTAITLSPMYLSTWPPRSVTSRLSRRRAPSTRAFVSSGSSCSAIAVYPDRSANSTVARRRSSLSSGGAATGVATGGGSSLGASDASSRAPHPPQNRAPGSLGRPQLGQAIA